MFFKHKTSIATKVKIVICIISFILASWSGSYSQGVPPAKNVMIYKTTYFEFFENSLLSAHLFLYDKATQCKQKAISDDSLLYFVLGDVYEQKTIQSNKPLQSEIKEFIKHYRDSLVSKDLLFDSEMREFSDNLSTGKPDLANNWQKDAYVKVESFQEIFIKYFWDAIRQKNEEWIKDNAPTISLLEKDILPKLESVFQKKLPTTRIRVDLVPFATWAGAVSYGDRFSHIMLSPFSPSNTNGLGLEVIFHEASHFLVDTVNEKIVKIIDQRKLKATISLWHDLIFYSTGYVMTEYYKKRNVSYVPYYKAQGLDTRFPFFKISVEACASAWPKYINGEVSMDVALNEIVDKILTSKR